MSSYSVDCHNRRVLETLRVLLVDLKATIPTKAHSNDAGFDLYSCEEKIIEPHTRALISTGIKLSIPLGYYGRIAPRSGMSVKGYDIGAGVIDYGFEDVIKVLLINNSNNVLIVEPKHRIAQLVIEKIYTGEIEQVASDKEIEECRLLTKQIYPNSSSRGLGGFGSSGV